MEKTAVEKHLIKKTVSLRLGVEDCIIALMSKIGFEEVERKTTGGYMSEERIQITFCGYNTDYHENDYIKVKSDSEGYFYFYSLRQPEGYYTNKLELFKELHDKKATCFEICSFESAT